MSYVIAEPCVDKRDRACVEDVIISDGHTIDPAVIEDALLRHPAVAAAAAVGRPDARRGETPVAYVALHPGATVTADDLRAWATGRIGDRIAVPGSVLVVDCLPLTAVGKPYRMAPRVDATRRVVTEALSALPGRVVVDAADVDGSIVVTIIARDVVLTDIDDALAGYAVTWRLEELTPWIVGAA